MAMNPGIRTSVASLAVAAGVMVGSGVMAPVGAARPAAEPGDFAPTYLSVTASPSPSLANQDVTFTMSVREASGAPVTFGVVSINGRGVGGPFELLRQPVDANGQITWTQPAALCCQFQASYVERTRRYDGSSFFYSDQRPDRFPTSLTVASSASATSSGDVVTFAAVVNATPIVDGGAVTFRAVDRVTGQVVLEAAAAVDAAGRASVSSPFDAAGNYAVTATYSGTDRFGPATAYIAQAVGCVTPLTATAVSLAASQLTSRVGEEVTFTGTVSASAAQIPVGSLEFLAGTTREVVAVDANGTATWTAPGDTFPRPETQQISASYLPGTSGYLESTAAIDHRVITDPGYLPGLTTLTISPNPAVVGEPVTVTVTVTTLDGQPYPLDQIGVFRASPYSDSDRFVPLVDGTGTISWVFQYPGTVRVTTSRTPEFKWLNLDVLPAPISAAVPAPPTSDQATAPAGTAPPVAATADLGDTATSEPAMSQPVATADPVITSEPVETTEPTETTEPVESTEPTDTTEPDRTTEPPVTETPLRSIVPSGFRAAAPTDPCGPVMTFAPAAPPPPAPPPPPPPPPSTPVGVLPATGAVIPIALAAIAAMLLIVGSSLVLGGRQRFGRRPLARPSPVSTVARLLDT